MSSQCVWVMAPLFHMGIWRHLQATVFSADKHSVQYWLTNTTDVELTFMYSYKSASVYIIFSSIWLMILAGVGGHGGGRRGQFALHWFCVYNLVCVCHRLPFWNFVKWTRPEQHIDPEFSVVTYIFKAETHFILLKCNFFTVNTKLQSTTVGSKLRLWKDAKVLCCFFFFLPQIIEKIWK